MKDFMVLFGGFVATMAIIIGASLYVIQPLTESSLYAENGARVEMVLSSNQDVEAVNAF